MLDFGEAVRRFYRNYTNADGRAQRSAYWWVVLYQLTIYAVLAIVVFMADGGDNLFNTINSMLEGNEEVSIEDDFTLGTSGIFAIILMAIFALCNFLPDIMLRIRRFHDLGQSGWLVLLFVVLGVLPIVGIFADLANFVWFTFRGSNGPNQYGQDPLGHDTNIFG